MKYRCFCECGFRDLTKEELKIMIRSNKRFKIDEFIKHYNIDADTYTKRIRALGFNLTRCERTGWRQENERVVLKEESNPLKNSLSYNPLVFTEIPKALICALYEIDTEVVNGKLVYDVEQFLRAKDDAEAKIGTFERKLSNDKEEYSNLKPIDLVAMRIYRGYNRKEFSKLTGLSLAIIKEYESKQSRIPKVIAKDYTDALNIRKRHVIQLRDIMKGRSKEITDDREIPSLIKLKVWVRDNGQCTRCSAKDKLHYHHIKRFADGGQNTEENLTLLCVSCHAEEHKGEKAYHMLKKMAEE